MIFSNVRESLCLCFCLILLYGIFIYKLYIVDNLVNTLQSFTVLYIDLVVYLFDFTEAH